jgi:hypothetical protein
MQGVLTLTQNGDSFDGSMTSDFGTLQIRDGQIDGRSISWTVRITNGPPQPLTVTYEGQVDGDRISGRVTAGEFGTFPFSAQRRP